MKDMMNTRTSPLRRGWLHDGDAGALYVQHFNVALINFEKHVREERLSRKARKSLKSSQDRAALQ